MIEKEAELNRKGEEEVMMHAALVSPDSLSVENMQQYFWIAIEVCFNERK